LKFGIPLLNGISTRLFWYTYRHKNGTIVSS